MGQKRTPGLITRNGVWHIEKRVRGRRVRESCGTGDRLEAEQYLTRRLEEIRQAKVYGVRPPRTFEVAASRFVVDFAHKRSLRTDIGLLRNLMPWIGNLTLDRVHMGTLQPWLMQRRTDGVAVGTINHGLKIVRRVLNVASSEWIDEYGLTWLSPRRRSGCSRITTGATVPADWEEQDRACSGSCRRSWPRWRCSR